MKFAWPFPEKRTISLCIALTCVANGCVRLPLERPGRPSTATPEHLAEKLQYSRGKSQVLSEYNQQINHVYRRWEIDLRVEMVDSLTNKTVTLEFYVPHSAQA